jgi:lipoprotein signal peptidase
MNLQDLAPLAIAFVFVAIVLGIGADVLTSIQSGQGYTTVGNTGCNSTSHSACGIAFNATGNGLSSVDELSGWLPTIALVVAAAVVIGVLAYFKA